MAQPSITSFIGTPKPSDPRTVSQSEQCSVNEGANGSIQCAQRDPGKSRKQASTKKTKRDKKAQRKCRRDEKRRSKGSKECDNASLNDLSQNQQPTSSRLEMDDQSLTELLGANSIPPTATSSPGNSDTAYSCPLRKTIHDLEKQVDSLSKQNSALQNQLDLLEVELDNAKKIEKTNKNELKRITKDNDNLRREISRISGLRKHLSDSDSGDNANETNNNQELLQTATTQLESLREHVAEVATTLLSYVKDSDNKTQASKVPRHQPHPAELPNAQTFPIPVVQLGLARQHAETETRTSTSHQREQNTYAEAAARQPPPPGNRPLIKPEVVMIGTSLTRGLGQKLVSRGVNATVHSYPGAEIPQIRDRVPHILRQDNTHKFVMLQCGGNDIEGHHVDRVIDQYEGLIKDVRRQCPNAHIILSAIPPRRNNKRTMRNIRYINDYLRDRGMRHDGVKTIDVVPKLPRHFLRDQVHFNGNGKQLYADNIKDAFRNFMRGSSTQSV